MIMTRISRASGGGGYEPRRSNTDYRVTLECGCSTRARLPPQSGGRGPMLRYMCDSGQGHGYRQRWVSWEGRGMSGTNPAVVVQADPGESGPA